MSALLAAVWALGSGIWLASGNVGLGVLYAAVAVMWLLHAAGERHRG